MLSLKELVNNKTKIVLIISLLSFAISISCTVPTYAISWNAGKIIDNIIFTNTNTMTVQSIQNFLNSKVPACDTMGTQTSEFGGGTRAQWGASNGTPAPFICLKDYTEGGKSSAQIIYDASQEFQINPQVLLVLLQKEQGLVTDTWPLPIQYRSATGYGCPDTAPCDSQYYGLTNQVRWSGRMFRSILNNSPDWYTPYVLGNNYIQYNPNASCGGSTVNIENRATQALYNYTPYQPNQAALDAGWGTVNCGAYGNRNFVLYFNAWFGATTNSNLDFSVIQGPSSSALYLQTSAGKYYILSGELMRNWGIDALPIQQVSQAYLDNLPTGPNIGNLLKDDWNNYFVVDGGKLHYVRDTSYLSLWNISTSSAVQSLGLTYILPSSSWLGRFLQDSSQPTLLYLMDKGTKHLISNSDSDMLYQWRYTPDQLTIMSSSSLNSIPTDPNDVTRLAKSGTTNYFIDTGRKLSFNDANIENAYYGSQNPVLYDNITLSFLPNDTARQFTINSSTGQWFMLEAGNKHYIGSASIAELWGKNSGTPLTYLSNGAMTSISSTGNLANIVQTSNPSMYWLIDGQKRYISDSNTANAWIKSGSTPPLYSVQSLNLLSRGTDAATTINASGSPYYYTMDAGNKRYLMTPGSKSGWGGSVMTTSRLLVDNIAEGSFLNFIAKDTNGQAYLLMNNSSYIIDPAYYSNWGVSNTTSVVDNITIGRYASSGITLKAFISINNSSYIMLNGNKSPISSSYDAYKPSSLSQINLPSDYFNTTTNVSYLIKSTDTQDKNVWMVNDGKKYLFSGFATYVSYGYLSHGVTITALPPETLSLIPNAPETPGLFIRTANSYGLKFINFGTSLGFPDGDTLVNTIGSMPILIVSDSIYNSIPLVGSTSKIVKDDAGKLYLMENGKRRWITNGKAYQQYSTIPITYLYGTTMCLIPEGAAIN